MILSTRKLASLRLGWVYLREFRWLFAGGMVLLIGASVFELAGVVLVIPLLEQIGTAPGDSDVARRARWVVTMLGVQDSFSGLLVVFAAFTLIKFALAEWAGYVGRVLSASIRFRMRQRIFGNLMDLPLAFYYNQRAGDIIASTDTSTTESAALVENLIRLLNMVFFAIVYLSVQLMVSGWMTLAVLGFTVASYYFVSPRFSFQFSQGMHEKRMVDATVSFLGDRLAGIKTIKAFGNDEVHRREFDRLGEELKTLVIGIKRNKIVAHAFGEPFTTVAVIAMLLLAVQVLRLTAVELLTFFYAYSLLVPRVKGITTESLTLFEKAAHFHKVDELITREGKNYLVSGTASFDRLDSDIIFDRVSFAYQSGRPEVLSGISLVISRMKTTALVGPSGVGKTTIADLLLRLHDPTAGTISVNGQDLRSFTSESWHRRVAVVEQDPFLFHDTILNNIRYGKPEATEDEVVRAARLAHADAFIDRLAQGYETPVGQRGMTLSGGQRQRIALARALIRQPDLLVLDEATSALDSESERFIKDAIEQIRRHCTMLIIAHRLSTIASADNIVIVEGGRIVEQGTHSDLLASEGLYARYHALQGESPVRARGEGE